MSPFKCIDRPKKGVPTPGTLPLIRHCICHDNNKNWKHSTSNFQICVLRNHSLSWYHTLKYCAFFFVFFFEELETCIIYMYQFISKSYFWEHIWNSIYNFIYMYDTLDICLIIIRYSDWLTAHHVLFLKQLHHSIKLIIHDNTRSYNKVHR